MGNVFMSIDLLQVVIPVEMLPVYIVLAILILVTKVVIIMLVEVVEVLADGTKWIKFDFVNGVEES